MLPLSWHSKRPHCDQAWRGKRAQPSPSPEPCAVIISAFENYQVNDIEIAMQNNAEKQNS